MPTHDQLVGGEVPRARIAVGGRRVRAKLGAKTRCRVVRVRRRPKTVAIRGRDRFGHLVKARAKVRPRRRSR